MRPDSHGGPPGGSGPARSGARIDVRRLAFRRQRETQAFLARVVERILEVDAENSDLRDGGRRTLFTSAASSLQPGHQDVQMLMTTGLPTKSSSEIRSPVSPAAAAGRRDLLGPSRQSLGVLYKLAALIDELRDRPPIDLRRRHRSSRTSANAARPASMASGIDTRDTSPHRATTPATTTARFGDRPPFPSAGNHTRTSSPASGVARRDLDRPAEHRRDAERVDRAHRVRLRPVPEPDTVRSRPLRERIGNDDLPILVRVNQKPDVAFGRGEARAPGRPEPRGRKCRRSECRRNTR